MGFRSFSILFLVTTVILFCGCGSDQNDSSPTSSPPTESSENSNANPDENADADSEPDQNDDTDTDTDDYSDPNQSGEADTDSDSDPDQSGETDTDDDDEQIEDRYKIISLEAEEADDGDISRVMRRSSASGYQTILLFENESITLEFDNPDPDHCSWIESMAVTIGYANPLVESSPELLYFYLNDRIGFNLYLHGSGDLQNGWNFIQRRTQFIREFRLEEDVNTIALSIRSGDDEGIEFDYVDLEFECID